MVDGARLVKFLVENKADIEIANRHGHTSLMIACYRQEIDRRSGCDHDDLVCFRGHVEVVRYLLSRGANVNRKSTKGVY